MSYVLFIMGVSGSGKTTIGRLLAEKLQIPFYDADDFHPQGNIEKMQSGIALTDADRMPWLERLHTLAQELGAKEGGIIACSALKESYRTILQKGINSSVQWILLDGEQDVILERLQKRKGHFMPAALLASQFDILEKPDYAWRIDINNTPDAMVKQIEALVTGSEIGLIGLGVMGRSLALNIAEKGFRLSLYNRHVEGKEMNIASTLVEQEALLHTAKPFDHLVPFIESLQVPRKILLIIEAGNAVDAVIEQIAPLLTPGDVIADCGNSHYLDTHRRQELLSEHGVYFMGVGVSGGEKGARHGASIMPGGSPEGYRSFQPLLERIAAKDSHQHPCCAYIGPEGSGHFVKMVHNGMEYAEMQLIAEMYGLFRYGHGYTPGEISDLFEQWQHDLHRSYLLEITVDILRKKEADTPLIDAISDAAKSKGTGSWVLQAASSLGIASPVIAAALHARFLSGMHEERTHARQLYNTAGVEIRQKDHLTPEQLAQYADTFYLARIINHHLGFNLLHCASDAFQWNLDLREIARVWTNGCIIRSSFMERLAEDLKPGIPLLLHEMIISGVEFRQKALSEIIARSIDLGIALPCHSAALHFLLGYTQSQPTGNLIQAQRDYFGSHGFERLDDPSGKIYHL